MSNFAKVIIIVLGLHLLWGGALYFRRLPIEQDLTKHVQAGLDLPEFSDVAVAFKGRDGTLSGTVASSESVAKAEKLAWGYWGVRTIDNRLTVQADRSDRNESQTSPGGVAVKTPAEIDQPPKMATIRGYQVEDKFMLSGSVPDWYTRSRLIAWAEELFGHGNVAIALRVDSDLKMPPDFLVNYRRFLDSHRLQAAGFEIENGEFTLKTGLPEEYANYQPVKTEPTDRQSAQTPSTAPMPVHQTIYQENSTADEGNAAAASIIQKQALNRLLSAVVIEFDTSSATLTPESRQLIDQAGEILNRYPGHKIEIQGHTDNIGAPGFNNRLSSIRARTVYHYLIENGVKAERLKVNGYGPAMPLEDNSTAEGRRRNRRVVFRAP